MTKKYMLILLVVLFSAVSEWCCAHDVPSTHAIDLLAQETLSEWNIPGLALAVVYHGKPMRVAGYGVKARGEADPVDEETLFQICSLTKAFAATTVAMLVDEGVLEWDRPIREYLPTFQLKDPYATEAMTLRDLLCNRTGLPGISKQCWRLWYHTNRTPDDLISRLKNVDPVYPFRSHFSYNNMAYAVAGAVVERMTGLPWTQVCEKRIFAPLGMKRTNVSYDRLMKDRNVAAPHLLPVFAKKPIPNENWDNMAPAAGINSCAQDMASWLLYCLGGSSVGQTIQKPQTLMEADGVFDPISSLAWPIYMHDQKIVNYGLGWMMYTLDNRVVIFHLGIGDGMQSILAIVPEEQLGIAILTNEAPHLGAACLLNELLDRFLHRSEGRWHARAHAVIAQMPIAAAEVRKKLLASRKEAPMTLPRGEYSGCYEHPAYGAVRVIADDDTFELVLPTGEKGVLNHWDADCFEVTHMPSNPFLPWIVEFVVSNDRGHVEAMKIPDLGLFRKK